MADGRLCSVRTFRGWKIESLTLELQNVRLWAKGYYDEAIVFVGTNNIMGAGFDLEEFVKK